MGCRVINNIRVNISGNNISDEQLSIHLKIVQDMLKRKIAKVNVSVDSDGVDIDSIYAYPSARRIGKRKGYLFRINAQWCDANRTEERNQFKLN